MSSFNQATTVPEHLRYKPIAAPNTFAHVESRYKSPPKHIDPERYYQQHYNHLFQKVRTNTNPQYAGVLPRYTSPVREPPQKSEGLKRTESVLATPEYAAHKRCAAAMGLGQVPSKYVEHAQKAAAPAVTRREEVEQKIAVEHRSVNKDGKPFALRKCNATTFDEARRYNEELKRWESPTRKNDGRPSVVMQYIAGAVDLVPPRSVSPKKEPVMMDGQIYKGGGGPVHLQKSPSRQVYKLEEEKVTALVERLRSARTTSPPRVWGIAKEVADSQPKRHRSPSPKPRQLSVSKSVTRTIKKEPETSAKKEQSKATAESEPTVVVFSRASVDPEPEAAEPNNEAPHRSDHHSSSEKKVPPLIFRKTEPPKL